MQDFDLWARLIRKYELYIVPDTLLHYRIRANDANLSSPKRDRVLRVKNEYYLVLRRYFDNVPSELFREAFADELINSDFADGLEYACEQAFAFGRSQMPLAKLIGVEKMHELINDPAAAAVLERRDALRPAAVLHVAWNRRCGGVVGLQLFDFVSGYRGRLDRRPSK